MTICNKQYNLKGRLVAFVGDTPAVNMAGGFKEGVGMAMRKCRHCMATDNQIQTKVISMHNYIVYIRVIIIPPLYSCIVCRVRISDEGKKRAC